ncbi:MAG TPA: acetoin utilization AcuC family protein [Dehalococcoidia bacterium]
MAGRRHAVLVYTPHAAAYDFGPEHPLRPERVTATLDLAREAGVLTPDDVLEPAPASRDELLLVHEPAYLDAVARLAQDPGAVDGWPEAARYGFTSDDNRPFRGMDRAAAVLAGGTLTAARAVMEGHASHAFHPSGGLHHAQATRASGFCIYNDAAVAIAALLREHEAKVLYVDFDAHHGDGVQAAFYDDPRVLTLSFHETGRYLFPGTGEVVELGTGAGTGFSINVPVTAFTNDASWLEAVEALLPGAAERFMPDVIVSQHGVDGHVWDPLSHLHLTTRAFQRQAALVHELAHRLCDGRWVATGGGGYAWFRVVPRAWTMLWAEMAGRPLPERVPRAWIVRWQPRDPEPLPDAWLDGEEVAPPVPRQPQITLENRATVARVRELAMSAPLRQAFRWGPAPGGRFPPRPGGARLERLDTPRGRLYLRESAPPSFVRRLRVDEGMTAFARRPDLAQALLRRIAGDPDGTVAIAHTPEGRIVGQVSVAPVDGRWAGLDGIYELALEVSRNWRGLGLAQRLLAFTLAAPEYEDIILLAMGYSWHWDLEGTGLSAFQYRDMLVRLLRRFGFDSYATDEPEIAADAANVLLARVGSRVPHDLYEEFYQRLLRPAAWRLF